jgi:hypothetical protein
MGKAVLKEITNCPLIHYQLRLSERTMDEKLIVSPHADAVTDMGVL